MREQYGKKADTPNPSGSNALQALLYLIADRHTPTKAVFEIIRYLSVFELTSSPVTNMCNIPDLGREI